MFLIIYVCLLSFLPLVHRWKDGDIRHVHISAEVHRNYERRITAALESYKKRYDIGNDNCLSFFLNVYYTVD